MRSFFLPGWFAALMLAILVGCNSSESDAPVVEGNGEEVPAAAEGVKSIEVEKLPKLGAYLPPQAGGVEVAPPDGWIVKSRDKKYVALFYHKDITEPPRIEITAADSPVEFTEVTAENVTEFAEAMKAHSKKQVLEPCIPIILGDSAWTRYVQLAKLAGNKVQIQHLQTVRGGKLYSVSLVVEGGESDVAEMKKNKNFGYAVAAGMKFGGEGAPPADSGKTFEVPKPEPETPPAEPKPDEGK